MYKYLCCTLLLILSHACIAEPKTYQTAPKHPVIEHPKTIDTPLISVNPASGETRLFITPDGSFSNGLVSHDTQVYYARALYDSSSQGIAASMVILHKQMADVCPQGWIKREEWTTLQSVTPELHFKFQCLHASPQD